MIVRVTLLVGVVAAVSACGGGGGSGSGGGGTRFPGGTQGCGIEVRGFGVAAATCFPSSVVRVVAVRVDPSSGDPIVVGTFHGRFELDPSHPLFTDSVAAPFVARLGSDLVPRYVRTVDAPGALRGVAIGTRGVAVITGATEASEGPFLTRLAISNGEVESRRDLAFGGLVGSVAAAPRGTIVMRVQNDGLRLVVTDEDGKVIASPRVAPPWIHQSPSSIAEGALTHDVAVGADGFFTAHAAADASEQAISKIASNGAVVWTRAAPISTNAQMVATSEGVAVLSPDASSICAGALGNTFAVTSFDREAKVRWNRCFIGQIAGLRLASDGGGGGSALVIAGQVKGPIDLGDGVRDAGVGMASFVVRFGDGGKTARSGWLTGPTYVANQAIAIGPNNAIFVAGVAGPGPKQTHFYVARLTE